MKALKQKNTLGKFITNAEAYLFITNAEAYLFITNAEAYLKPSEISKMELFGLTVFAKKLHHRFSIGF